MQEVSGKFIEPIGESYNHLCSNAYQITSLASQDLEKMKKIYFF